MGTPSRRLLWTLAPLVGSTTACTEERELPPAPVASAGQVSASSGSSTGTGDTGDCTPGEPACECILPHAPCEGDDNDVLLAMGLCPDRVPAMNASVTTAAGASGVFEVIGGGDVFTPREGDTFAVMGSGLVDEFANGGECTSGFSKEYQLGNMLPAPIRIDGVGNVDCTEDPSLVGMGDCSNTIASQFDQGMNAFDYSEIRLTTEVPADATALAFDFAFFSTEYPEYFGTEFNDMFIAWLESEQWTGNISFDENGNPISLNAGFLDFRDDMANLPQFQGTCMVGNAATRWLTSQAAVTGGETITVVWAIFDLSDQLLDSFVILDEFRWGCDPDAGGPMTMPGGSTGGADSTGGDSTTGG